MNTLPAKTKITGLRLIKLHIVLALLAGVHPSLAQVTNLGIAAAGGQSILYWPTSTTNYVLQTTASLSSPNWMTATNTVAVNAVTVSNSAPSGYFRLLQSTNPAGMVLIPAGSFMMGNYVINNFYNLVTNDADIIDANPTNVYVSAFFIDVNLVNYGLWVNVCSYAAGNGYNFAHPGVNGGTGTIYPVEAVDWFDCVAWCNARSQQAGLAPCYYSDAGFTQLYTNASGANIYLNMANNGYRLPTEAEWEKAARGSLTGNRFPWGNIITESQAIYYATPTNYSYDVNSYSGNNTNFNTTTSPVGYFAPNGYGLYDMAGSVYEWCWDWYAAPPYPSGSPYLGGISSMGPATGSTRVVRGGFWGGSPGVARCAYRYKYSPLYGVYVFGFRCVRGL